MARKHKTQPDCPLCNEGLLQWTVEERQWFCPVCWHTQDLVHWLIPGATRRIHTQSETFGDDPEYQQEWDVMSGKFWWRRRRGGTRASRSSQRPMIYQVPYSDDQYDLIGWCVWAREENGWSITECYEIIRHFWKQQPAQTPLVLGVVTNWYRIRKRMKKRGLQWP